MRSSAVVVMAVAASLLGGCAGDGGSGGSGGSGAWTSGGGGSGGQPSGGGGQGGEGLSGGGGSAPAECIPASGSGQSGTDTWSDPPYQAQVLVDDALSCARSYTLSTTQPLRDDLPANPRTISELPSSPVLRSGHDLFDSLYALAQQEVRECSVDSISDWAFNGGAPIACPPGGCFETGRLWTYVWTRDTAYSVLLGLGLIDPLRARNSLAFKLSERRAGGDLQIVQDTGSGGSYPVSSDRVVWALGAWEVLKYLDGSDRSDFLDLAYEAIANTADHDRAVVFDPSDGLYRGEQSFLDWREQSYPGWTANDTVQIAMSKALSTNLGHLRLLQIAAALASDKGLSVEAAQYQGWADALESAIATRFWVADDTMLSSFIPSDLDPAPTRRYDLLGSALAVLGEVGSAQQRRELVASYPHLPKGAPVIWPQQQDVPIYHNRGIWPFVSALWLKAAKAVDNAAVVDRGVRSLLRGAALNLSNMENFEVASGAPWVDEGPTSGPVVSSQRQLWSVAGYLSMVQDVLFGLEASQTGIRFSPYLPRALRNSLFAGADTIALSRLPYKGKRLSVVLHLGAADGVDSGALVATSVSLDGVDVGSDFVEADSLGADSVFDVTLGPAAALGGITELSEGEVADYQNLFGPRTPAVTSVSLNGGLIAIGIDIAGESAQEVALDVYRDGQRVAQDLPGTTSTWVDPGSGQHASRSYCYSVEARFISSSTRSQRAQPSCYWGAAYERIASVGAQSMVSNGGTLVFQYGRWHYQGWGDASHTLTVQGFTPSYTGKHLLQLDAGNGAGPFDTGITCGVKLVQVLEGGNVVASGYLVMPQLGSWDAWRGSSFLSLDLDSSKTYDIVIGEDARAINMSEREHFSLYGGEGGTAGRFNRVNVAEVKLLAAEL